MGNTRRVRLPISCLLLATSILGIADYRGGLGVEMGLMCFSGPLIILMLTHNYFEKNFELYPKKGFGEFLFTTAIVATVGAILSMLVISTFTIAIETTGSLITNNKEERYILANILGLVTPFLALLWIKTNRPQPRT